MQRFIYRQHLTLHSCESDCLWEPALSFVYLLVDVVSCIIPDACEKNLFTYLFLKLVSAAFQGTGSNGS